MTLGFAVALVAGSALLGAKLGVALAIAIVGGTWDAARDSLLVASIGLIGAGAAGLSLMGAAPLDRRSTRVGLGIFALGLLTYMAGWLGIRDLSGEGVLSSPGLFLGLGGLIAGAVGALVTALSLAASSDGRSRAVGFGFLGGMLTPVLPMLTRGILTPVAIPLAVTLLILSCAGVGLLALADAYEPARRAART